MPEGTIKNWKGTFGFIEQTTGGDVFFHITEWHGPSGEEPTPGMRVTYEVGTGRDGRPAAKNVQLTGRIVAQPVHAAPLPRRRAAGKYRFLNPYNFVRPLTPADPESEPLLGRCPPPPHDRYVGLTGRIECELTAETPLFIVDSERVWPDPDLQKRDHYHYEFFKYGGQEAIPATSLRGVMRSTFEAATNSSFPVFDPGRLDYRRGFAPPGMTPARVVDLDHETGKATLELLDGTRKRPQDIVLHMNPRTKKPLALINAAPVPAYLPKVLDTRTKGTFDPKRSRIPRGAEQGVRVAALLRKELRNKRRYQHFVIDQLVLASEHESLSEDNGHYKIFGYLYVTGPNIENKHDERLFFRWDDEEPAPTTPEAIPEGCVHEVPAEVIEEYNQHLAEYWDRNERQVRRLNEQNWPLRADALPHPSSFVRKGKRLEKGDLVYYVENGPFGVPLLRPVSMPRMPYASTRGDLLQPDELHKCNAYDALCPACRVFGWVWGTGTEGEQTPEPPTPIAYAGRVRFSYGCLAHKAGTFDATLAILSTPKPTTTRFYLIHRDGRPRGWTGGRYDRQAGREDEAAGYDGPNVLRGRKFYRHHGSQLREQEYERAGGVQDDQNRTVHGVLEKGSKFTFTVHFENLAPVELGALLWALEMEDGWHNRIGLGKPLGFGSVQIKIKDAGTEVLNPETRYTAWGNNGWSPLLLEQRQKLVGQFKQAMAHRYGATSFEDLDNIRDMEALLTEPPDLPIHYPRSTSGPQKEGKNYEWFVGNKRGGQQHGPRIELPSSTDERQDGFEGLPLLNDRGDEV
jgi:CRISPR-associated protein (TIGR03986 family)